MAFFHYPPAPGTKFGPCEGDCEHKDCAQLRRDSEKTCRICGGVIGYESYIGFEPATEPGEPHSIVHFSCALQEVAGHT